jgi:diguanylate cyclase (GGDEF)-like protein
VPNPSPDLSRPDRRVDGLMQLALAAAVVLLASSMVRLAVTRFGYDPTLNRLHAAQVSQAAADRAMVDMDNGVLGYQLSGDDRFLEPYTSGQGAFQLAAASARTSLRGFTDLTHSWDAAVAQARVWQQHYATTAIAQVRPAGPRPSVSSLLGGTAGLAEYRDARATAEAVLADSVARQRSSENMLRTSTGVTQAVALALLVFALIRRQRRPELRSEVAPRTPSVVGRPTGFTVSGDLDALALSIASAGRELSGAMAAHLWLAEGDDLRRVEPGGSIIVAQRRRHDVALRAHREGAITTSVSRSRRTLAVPLLHEGRTLGVVELSLPAGSAEPTHAQIEMLRAWGRQAAKAIAYGPGSAGRDRLTGFSGRATMVADLVATLDAAVETDGPVSLVVLEVDHLDLGTAEGTATRDELVRTVGAVLADTVRTTDTPYRTGEGSFAVLLPGAPAAAAASLAERLRQIIARRFVERGVTASFGVATCPDVASDSTSLLEAAEAALYDAQRFGGNRTQSARPLHDELALVRQRVTKSD